jgi:hypothetical protein
MTPKACFTGFSAFQYYKSCVNGQHSHILLKRLCYVHSRISVRTYYYGGLLAVGKTLQQGRREGILEGIMVSFATNTPPPRGAPDTLRATE